MPRRLRIAVSAFFGLLTVAVGALWVWNQWCHDTTVISRTEIHFVANRIVLHINPSPRRINHFLPTRPIEESWQYVEAIDRNENRWGFGHVNDWGTHVYITPHWFYVLAAGTAAAAPWAPYRFSLRNLLIATTLLGVLMGCLRL